jgi:RES domain-containing protein
MRLRTTVYRAHNPRWSFAPLSAAGAARYGGRFNPTGMEVLYTFRRFETAWLEAQQGFAFKAQPLERAASGRRG